jgi:hypothetical protein
MTRQDEITDLQKRIADQVSHHKTRSGLTHRLLNIRLLQLQEEAMDDQQEKTPEHRVGMALYFLRDSIRHLQELREANDTADLILGHSFEINTMKVWLENLADDIHKAAHKDAAE